jgi:hypothetical protein
MTRKIIRVDAVRDSPLVRRLVGVEPFLDACALQYGAKKRPCADCGRAVWLSPFSPPPPDGTVVICMECAASWPGAPPPMTEQERQYGNELAARIMDHLVGGN